MRDKNEIWLKIKKNLKPDKTLEILEQQNSLELKIETVVFNICQWVCEIRIYLGQ